MRGPPQSGSAPSQEGGPEDPATNQHLGASTQADRLQEQVERFGNATARSRAILAHLETLADPSPAIRSARAKMRQCASYLLFHHYYLRGEVRLAAVHHCDQHLLCPFCAYRRSGRLVRRVHERATHVLEQYPTLRPFHVVLTVRNDDDLGVAYRKLDRALKAAVRRRRNALAGQQWSEFARMAGAIASIEVTHSPDTGWHPHVHVLALSESYFDAAALKAEWLDLTGDSHVVQVDEGRGDPLGVVMEVCKYATKFQDLTPDSQLEAFRTLKGKRLVRSFGLLRGVKLPDAGPDELRDDEPYIELLYRYREDAGCYDLSRWRDVATFVHTARPAIRREVTL